MLPRSFALEEKGRAWFGLWPVRMTSSPFYHDVFGDAPQVSCFLTWRGSGCMSWDTSLCVWDVSWNVYSAGKLLDFHWVPWACHPPVKGPDVGQWSIELFCLPGELSTSGFAAVSTCKLGCLPLKLYPGQSCVCLLLFTVFLIPGQLSALEASPHLLGAPHP